MDSTKLWDSFAKHIEYDLAAGGPDPHMRCVGWMMRNESIEEKLWRAACYVGVYNVPSAEIIWQSWSWKRAKNDPQGLISWIDNYWKGINFRRERRAVRTPKKLGKFFLSYIEFAKRLPSIVLPLDPHQAYRELWIEINKNLYGAGRYACSKFMEIYQRYCDFPIDTPDILPRGGWSPRLTLLHLFKRPEIDPYSDTRYALQESNLAAEEAREKLAKDYNLPLDIFRLEVFLCDFRQSYEGGRQYPGRSNDSEIMYYDKAKLYWPSYQTEMFDARAELMPSECRGEIAGWRETREELGGVLKNFGYVWSDLLYKYKETEDFSSPIERENGAYESLRDIARKNLSARKI